MFVYLLAENLTSFPIDGDRWVLQLIGLVTSCVLGVIAYSAWKQWKFAQQQRTAPSPLQLTDDRREQAELELRLLYNLLGRGSNDERLGRLLAEMTPNNSHRAALLFRWDSGQFRLLRSTGLTGSQDSRIILDSLIAPSLTASGMIVRTATEIDSLLPVRGFSPADRALVTSVRIWRLGSVGQLWGALVLAHWADDVPPNSQDERMWGRVLTVFGDDLARTEHIVARESELAMTREMLELRSLTDHRLDNPAEMFRQFLEKLARLSDFDRAALYVRDHGDHWGNAILSTGKSIPEGQEEDWRHAEQRAINSLAEIRSATFVDAHDLFDAEVTPFSTFSLVPILRDGATVAMLALSRRHAGQVNQADQRLINWAADHLLGLMTTAVDRMTVEHEARIDSLTLLANRRVFDSRFEEILSKARLSGSECAVLLLDLDHFKSVNDKRGHLAGDAALKAVSRIVERVLALTRETDRPLAARYGGEELAVLLPSTGPAGARRIAEAIREAVERTPIEFDDQQFHVTLSGGIAVMPYDGTSARSLLTAADSALYTAKASGRNCIEVAQARELHMIAGL